MTEAEYKAVMADIDRQVWGEVDGALKAQGKRRVSAYPKFEQIKGSDELHMSPFGEIYLVRNVDSTPD